MGLVTLKYETHNKYILSSSSMTCFLIRSEGSHESRNLNRIIKEFELNQLLLLVDFIPDFESI